jgi:hypothetical protein
MNDTGLEKHGLEKLANLHNELAERLAETVWENSSAFELMLLNKAPGVGKTSILGNIKSALERKAKDKDVEFFSNKCLFGNSAFDLLQSNCNATNINQRSQAKGSDRVKIILIDDLEECFNAQYEEWIKKICAGDFQEKMIVIATSTILEPSSRNMIGDEADVDESTFDMSSSLAIHQFTPVKIEPVWMNYFCILADIFKEVPFSHQGLKEQGQRLQIQNMLKFAGPFPPVIKQIMGNLAFGAWHKKSVMTFGNEKQNRQLAEELLNTDLKYVYFAALDWVHEKLPYNYKKSADLASAAAFYQTALPFLVLSCLVWDIKSGIKRDLPEFDFKQPPILFQVAFASWKLKRGLRKPTDDSANQLTSQRGAEKPTTSVEKSKKTVEKAPYDAEGGGGKLLIKHSDGNKTAEIELSPVEWQVFTCLEENKAVEVKAIAEQLGQDGEFTEPKIRSALSRIDDKLKAADLTWIMQNFPRRGYLIRLQEPESGG